METHGEISEKPLKNHAKNKNEFEKKRFILILFSIKIPNYRKNSSSKILYMFRDIDKKYNA